MLGLLISIVSGFTVGNRVTYIVFVSGVSSFIFSLVGFGVYFILESKVPEFLEFLGGIEIRSAGSGEKEDSPATGVASPSRAFSGNSGDSNTSDLFGAGPSVSVKAKVKDGKYGDHIMAENIAIKNEPKLMAEAIRTMMARDDEPGS